MKKLLVLMLFLLFSETQAAEIYIQPSNGQMPPFYSSQASYDWQGSDYDQYIWDNFTLGSTSVITEIHWSGKYVNGGFIPTLNISNPVKDFIVSIYASMSIGEPDLRIDINGNPHPLVRYAAKGNANETPPKESLIDNSWHDYSFVLPTPFQATGGTEYWLQIEGIQNRIADWGIAGGSGSDGSSFGSIYNGGFSYWRLGWDVAFTFMGAVGPVPDLVTSSLIVPARSGAGLTIQVTDTTNNNGASTAGPSTTRFYLCARSRLDGTAKLLGKRPVPSLGVGASDTATTSLGLPSPLKAGKYYILAKADGPNAVIEAVENNNTKFGSILIGPDLIVSSLTVPANSKSGSTISVGDTTKNNGGGYARASSTSFYLSTDTALDAGDALLGSRAVQGLAAGASRTGATQLVIPPGTLTGVYYILAVADGPGAVVETSETNNKKNKPITVVH